MEISGKKVGVVGGASGFGRASAELLASRGAAVAIPKRLGKPEDFAKLVAAIVDNPMLNGQCLRLDAGQRFGPKLQVR